MKKCIYYTIPFVLIPAVMLLCEYIDNTNAIPMSPFFCIITLIFISFIMGILSHSNNNFDYVMSAIMPLSLFCFMFIIGLISKSDLGTRFHLSRAFSTAFQPVCLIEYCCMAISAFLSSHKKVRIKISKSANDN